MRDWGLDPDIEERALELFAAVVSLPDTERAAALDAACAGNARLREAIDGLLRDHDAPPPILSRLLHGNAGPGSGPLRPGAQIGPYCIVDVIGRGGMGIVYRALQDRPRRSVALKVMSLGIGQQEALHRFEREVEVLGLLQHPGICSIHGAGAIDLGAGLGEVPYFANVWEWQQSHYEPYPGYKPFDGALMEYNGKFMDNQRVLRGGSFATPRSSARLAYRNFWPPATRFQATGVRLVCSS